MIKRNPRLSKLQPNYLFPEINLRKQAFLLKNPQASLISLGVGDTTEPIPPYITQALTKAAEHLGTAEGYSGYGPYQGIESLRKQIAAKLYGNKVKADDIFISDGSKCDIGRLQTLFGSDVSIAVQDPVYPVYFDGSLLQGITRIVSMPCTPENDFFPDLDNTPRTDLIYFCSPNNPTGAAATCKQLKQLVDFAKANRSLIIFDAAYACYIQDPLLPKSIFEIEGAHEVAIELGSFSKLAGFTGIRLAWSIIPDQLVYEDGASIKKDWSRVIATIFNGASNIAQHGGCGVLDEEGLREIAALVTFYLENTSILRQAMLKKGYEVYGGVNAPYLWVRFPGKSSWEMFEKFLEENQLITTPGIGFGPVGESFIRFTAFGHRENILRAAERL